MEAAEKDAVTANYKILSDLRAKRKKAHPLKMPLRLNPVGIPICRFHNYDAKKGCMKGADKCGLDHSLCHICLVEGHTALSCPYFNDDEQWKRFLTTYTLLNTRPPDYQKKTVLGDVIVWDTAGLPLECRGDEGQLRRCRKHKRFEVRMEGGVSGRIHGCRFVPPSHS